MIRIEPLDQQGAGTAERIHAVLLPAHAQEAQWLQSRQAPPLQRTPDTIRSSRDYFLGAFAGNELVGVLSVGPDEEPAQLAVTLLVVHPAHQRQGAAGALLQEMLRRGDGMAFCVTTGSANVPALALYARHGFAAYRHGTMGDEELGVVKLRRLAATGTAAVSAAAVDRAGATGPLVRAIRDADRAAWAPLWDGYNAFYGRSGDTALAPAITQATWQRFFDPAEPVFALVAVQGGNLVGLAHYLFHRSTTRMALVCYLQDLYTAPEARGHGVGRALIAGVDAEARAAGTGRVYWMTHQTNAAGRRLYDKVATHDGFIVYGHPV